MDVLLLALSLLAAAVAGVYRMFHRTAGPALPPVHSSHYGTLDRDLARQAADLAAIAAHAHG